MADLPDDNKFRWSWKKCFGGSVGLWRRDKLFFFLFLAVNLFAGQIGVLASLAMGYARPEVDPSGIWKSNIEAAALYTFSITLLAGALGSLMAELIDKTRSAGGVDNFEYKAFWAVIAGALIMFQSPIAGDLIARSTPSLTKATATTSIAQAPHAAASPPSAAASAQQKDSSFRIDLQVVLWLLSMFTALELFCQQRTPLIPANFAADRTREARKVSKNAGNASQTGFNEAI